MFKVGLVKFLKDLFLETFKNKYIQKRIFRNINILLQNERVKLKMKLILKK